MSSNLSENIIIASFVLKLRFSFFSRAVIVQRGQTAQIKGLSSLVPSPPIIFSHIFLYNYNFVVKSVSNVGYIWVTFEQKGCGQFLDRNLYGVYYR